MVDSMRQGGSMLSKTYPFRAAATAPRLATPVHNDGMIEFRPASEEDLPEIHRIWWAADPFR